VWISVAGSLILLCLVAGCIGFPTTSEQSMKGEGITIITPQDSLNRVSFNEAYSALQNYDTVNKTTIYYIRGDSVDANGRAKHWIFGIKQGQEQSFAIFDSAGLTFMPWNGKITYSEIPVDKIVKPEDLIKGHRVVIQEVQHPDIDEIELLNGVYALSITTGSEGRTLRFNALTGNAIS
jgi:hypothetical protein